MKRKVGLLLVILPLVGATIFFFVLDWRFTLLFFAVGAFSAIIAYGIVLMTDE